MVTALVNACIFALMPLVIMLLTVALAQENGGTSVTVRPEGASPLPLAAISTWTEMWRVLLPLSLIAGWRTFVHARRRLMGDDRSWRGVLEAGACGFLYVLWILRHGIVTQPTQAPPYVVAYGGLGLVIGLITGLVLRTTALLTLRLSRRVAA